MEFASSVTGRTPPATAGFFDRARAWVVAFEASGGAGRGLSKREIIRCLKRYVAREMFTALTAGAVDSPPATTAALSTAA